MFSLGVLRKYAHRARRGGAPDRVLHARTRLRIFISERASGTSALTLTWYVDDIGWKDGQDDGAASRDPHAETSAREF